MDRDQADRSNIDRLRDRLYSPHTEKPILDDTRGVHFDVEDAEKPKNQKETPWPSTAGAPAPSHPHGGARFFKIFFTISVLFCAVTALIAGYVFLSGWNQISSDNVDVTVIGPVSVSGGEILSFVVGTTNNNPVNLEDVRINIEYPAGSRDTTSLPLPRDERSLGVVLTGAQKQTNFQAVLFGEENVVQHIPMVITYRVPGSDTVYRKEKVYDILLTKAPVSLLIEYPKNANANQEMTMTITAISNSRARLDNVLLKITYPYGFTFASANPVALSSAQDTWQLGSFDPGQKKVVTLKGVVRGEDGEDKVFRVAIGTPQENDEQMIDAVFSNMIATIHLEQPFISSNLSLGTQNKDGDVVHGLGARIEGEVSFTNNLPQDLIDVVVRVIPRGTYYDRFSIRAETGFYKSVDNVIYWDKHTMSDLATLNPGTRRAMIFSFNTISMEQIGQLIRNPQMVVDVEIQGKTIGTDGAIKDVVTRAARVVKFSTTGSLSVATLYQTGPLKNNGPIPPRAEQKTTYTLSLSVGNTSNQISDGVITANLPIFAQWMGTMSPAAEMLTYDPRTRNITWRVGEVPAYAGVRGPARTVYFQVELFPSVSQIGGRPVLLSDVVFTGVDRFTGNVIKLGPSSLNTNTSDGSGSGTIAP